MGKVDTVVPPSRGFSDPEMSSLVPTTALFEIASLPKAREVCLRVKCFVSNNLLGGVLPALHEGFDGTMDACWPQYAA